MYKIIGGDRREYGPVSAEDLQRWVREGRLNGQSLVLPEGATEWVPLSSLPEFAAVLQAQINRPPPVPGPVVAADLEAWRAHLMSTPMRVRIGQCLARSWRLWTGNFGVLSGACAVVWLGGLMLERIPFIGGFVFMAFYGVLYGGLYLVFLKRIRGEPASIGDVFAGFRDNFTQLLLAGLLTTVLGSVGLCCLILPGVYLLVAWMFSLPLVADKKLEFWSAMELSRQVSTRVWFELFALSLVSWVPLLLVAMFIHGRNSLRFISSLLELLRAGAPEIGRMTKMVEAAAVMPFSEWLIIKVVLLLNLPFAVGALMYAYEDLFGSRATSTT